MNITLEHVDDVHQEIDALIHEYYKDKRLLDGLPEIDMNWQHYMQLHRSNALLIVTCRGDDGALDGVGMYVLTEHPHYNGLLFGLCDTLAVHPARRRLGIGRTIVKAAEVLLHDRGARYMTQGSRTVYEEEPLFPRLGFRVSEHTYIKELV